MSEKRSSSKTEAKHFQRSNMRLGRPLKSFSGAKNWDKANFEVRSGFLVCGINERMLTLRTLSPQFGTINPSLLEHYKHWAKAKLRSRSNSLTDLFILSEDQLISLWNCFESIYIVSKSMIALCLLLGNRSSAELTVVSVLLI